MVLSTQSLIAQVLYKISSNSSAAPSYILATNKLKDMTFIDTIPNVFKCFNTCITVTLLVTGT